MPMEIMHNEQRTDPLDIRQGEYTARDKEEINYQDEIYGEKTIHYEDDIHAKEEIHNKGEIITSTAETLESFTFERVCLKLFIQQTKNTIRE